MRSVLALGAAAGLTAAAPLDILGGLIGSSKGENDPSRYQYYNMPTPLAGPCDLANGHDGFIWGEDILTNNIFTINPDSGEVKEYPIPFTGPALPLTNLPGTNSTGNRGAFACAIRDGADGNMYAASGIRNQFIKINTQTKEMKVFSPPPFNALGNLEPFNDLWTDDKGMWFTQTTGNVLTFFDYATEEFTNYPVPTPLAGPLGVYVAKDGYLWLTYFLGQKIARFDRHTHEFKEFPIDSPFGLGPAVIRAESDGKIWFTALVGNGIGSVDQKTFEMKVYHNNLNLLSLPSENTVSPDGRVWFSTITQNSINYIEPKSGKITNLAQPDTLLLPALSLPVGLEVAVNYRADKNGGGAIWFTDALNNRVGRYTL